MSRNFYSRPCGRGDDVDFIILNHSHLISTHAPAGGATLSSVVFCILSEISTHAPAGGATHNSKPCYRIVKISTHAPAGGATRTAERSIP